MENIISKELWLEVIKPIENTEIFKDGIIESFEIKDNTLYACIFYESKNIDCKGTGLHSPHNINIYELAYKCKEWALNNGYEIYSKQDGFCGIGLSGGDDYGVYWDYVFYADAEIEAIFKACEWIRKELLK